MKSFLKENTYSMAKLFLNQIAITVFASMLSIATFSNRKALLFISIFSILFFLYLNYSVGWEIGAKDKIRIDGGRMKPMPLKGLYLAIGANVPNFIFAVLIGIGAAIDTKSAQSMSMICDLISRFLNNMYFGVMNFLEYAIYRNAAVADAAKLLGESAQSTPEIATALELITDPSYTIQSLRNAIDSISVVEVPEAAVSEALTLLNDAAYSPQLTENWWWFLVIIIPALFVGWCSYVLGTKNFRILSLIGINPQNRKKNK